MYKCSNCGYTSAKWLGRCPTCEEWESFYEEAAVKKSVAKAQRAAVAELTPLSGLTDFQEQRRLSGIGELDRVLGGGLIPGSVVLIGGEPGIGKSTLLLETASRFAADAKVIYVSAEESLNQVSSRARRLNVNNENLLFTSLENVEDILPLFERPDVALIIIDSIQVVGFAEIAAAKGSVVQVRESAHILTQQAKRTGKSLFIVGHVTKDGAISGPKLLEHIVDCVIYFEGERNSHYRILRAVKNRFGSVGEIGVFEMTSAGLKGVDNPSSIFVSEHDKDLAGRSIGCILEGVRPLLVEVQALSVNSDFGNPARRSAGFSGSKLPLIIAMMEKRLGMDLSRSDIFVNVTGGIKIDDPAADLAVVAAICAAHQNRVLPSGAIYIGETGLLGELRSCAHLQPRLAEAQRLGFKRAFIPRINYDKIKKDDFKDLSLVPVKDVEELQRNLY